MLSSRETASLAVIIQAAAESRSPLPSCSSLAAAPLALPAAAPSGTAPSALLSSPPPTAPPSPAASALPLLTPPPTPPKASAPDAFRGDLQSAASHISRSRRHSVKKSLRWHAFSTDANNGRQQPDSKEASGKIRSEAPVASVDNTHTKETPASTTSPQSLSGTSPPLRSTSFSRTYSSSASIASIPFTRTQSPQTPALEAPLLQSAYCLLVICFCNFDNAISIFDSFSILLFFYLTVASTPPPQSPQSLASAPFFSDLSLIKDLVPSLPPPPPPPLFAYPTTLTSLPTFTTTTFSLGSS
ncbi:uncharacterized protein MONOS_9920 [Monocercomonoides exilis]|uniref:uncharacterized protein n=1 Tax=Monocercomonoides exilis TaxID=2049356 RepID=UPI00355966B0|nr:hypothetical protein MONOS_9920 [Monocercomonoides exilis]|eukprot:MONOS_9920.1-p1 / transcript=MONOS_9920.1 / gene=MONOS_9920 / organism=Monocercomonoides_exilis_PA203 / gene_product=hypothetical protein / transcript_product=hypothetical protein / location=Mono_scaffold00427:30449-32023(+) / protein_length=300 / sequence_SO=supercontig / SO=protein_coding / is_pseudo=false